jgi:hypothetical protein
MSTSTTNGVISALNSLASSCSVFSSSILPTHNDFRARNFITIASSTSSSPATAAQERALTHVYRLGTAKTQQTIAGAVVNSTIQ